MEDKPIGIALQILRNSSGLRCHENVPRNKLIDKIFGRLQEKRGAWFRKFELKLRQQVFIFILISYFRYLFIYTKC